MSALGFEVHVDKENATPAPSINKGGALKNFGLRGDSWKLQQTVPRKALLDVINEPANVASRGLGGKQLHLTKDRISSSSKNISSGAENVQINLDNKKQGSKIQSSKKRGLAILKDAETDRTKTKQAVTQNKPLAPPKSKSEPEVNDEDYDSDAIFPKSERLSSYVNKLLTWRPPCLFGALPDSESDNSDLEELPQDMIILDMPLFSPTDPEFSHTDLVKMMTNFTPPKPEYMDRELGVGQENDTEFSLDLTNDMSFTFGSLHVMHGSLDNSHISDANSASDLDTNAS